MRYLIKVFFLLMALVFVAAGTPFYTDTINLDMDLQQTPDEQTNTFSLEYALSDMSNIHYDVDLWIETDRYLNESEAIPNEHFSAALLLDGEEVRRLTFMEEFWLSSEQENGQASVTYSNVVSFDQETLNLPDGSYELRISAVERELDSMDPLSIPIKFASLTDYQPATNQLPSTNSLGLRLHFPDVSSRYLIPITRFVPQTNTTLRETVIQLESGPSPAFGLFDRSPIPPVPRIQLSGGTASLYLSSQLGFYNEYPNVAQMAARSLVESLGSIPEVIRIQFYFDNRIIDEGFVSVDTGDVTEPAAPPFIYPVYRSPNGRGLLVPVPFQNGLSSVEALLAALTFKHNESFYGIELQPTVPQGVELLDYSLEGATLMVNFNQAFTQHFMEDPFRGRMMIDSLLLTFASMDEVDNVLFRVNGQVPLIDANQLLDQPLMPPTYINPENP